MTPEEMKKRTKDFALRAIRLCDSLPNHRSADIVARQLIRSATSTGANYRAVCRARSDADFLANLDVALEEADESVYWLEIIVESQMKTQQEVAELLTEGHELVAIFVSSLNTVRSRVSNPPGPNAKSRNSNLKSEMNPECGSQG